MTGMTGLIAAAGGEGRPGRLERLDLRLLPGALVVWAAAAWCLPRPPLVLAAAGVACALVAVVLLGGWRRAPSARVAQLALVLVLVAAVCASALAARTVRERGALVPLAGERAVVEVRGSALGDAQRIRPDPARPWARDRPRHLLRLHVEQVRGRGTVSAAHAEVLVVGGATWAGVRRGDEVSATGRLEVAAPQDRAVAVLTAGAAPAVSSPSGTWQRAAQRLRAGLVAACAGLPADARALVPGLVVGDTTALPDDLDAAMRATGLGHLTAVSGGNTAVVTGAALVLAAAAGAGRRARLVVAGLALVAFAVLAGAEPSVLRAAVMGAVVLVGAAGSRGGGGLPALAASVVVLLVADPWLARSAGFALSVLATGGLLLLVPLWAGRVVPHGARRGARRGRRVLVVLLVVPVVAQVVCAPVVLLLAPGLPLLAVPANALAGPAVAPATLLGLVALVLEPLAPGVAHLAAAVAGWGAQWVALVARTGAAAPVTHLPWSQGPLPALALVAAQVVLACALGAAVARRGRAR